MRRRLHDVLDINNHDNGSAFRLPNNPTLVVVCNTIHSLTHSLHNSDCVFDMRAVCTGPWVSESKNQASIGGCYKDRGTKINGFSSFINDKKILMYWQPYNFGQWIMGDAVGKSYRAYANAFGAPGPTAIAPDAWYTYSGGWVKERLVVGE